MHKTYAKQKEFVKLPLIKMIYCVLISSNEAIVVKLLTRHIFRFIFQCDMKIALMLGKKENKYKPLMGTYKKQINNNLIMPYVDSVFQYISNISYNK